MTTSKAIEVLKLLSDYHLYHSLDSEQIKALDKAVEVMGSSCDNCTNQHRDFTPSYNFIDEENNEL